MHVILLDRTSNCFTNKHLLDQVLSQGNNGDTFKGITMALEIVESPPALQDFTLLSEHEEQTPNSFFPAKPVLHLHSPGANVKIPLEDVESQPALAGLRDEDVAGDEGQVVIEGVDIWVSSRLVMSNCLDDCT